MAQHLPKAWWPEFNSRNRHCRTDLYKLLSDLHKSAMTCMLPVYKTNFKKLYKYPIISLIVNPISTLP